MFEKFGIDDNNIFKVCVVATMSSGKSTFINSIIGDEIMPEKNEACTAKTMAVLDNDAITAKRVHIIRKNGDKEIVDIYNREVLDRVNKDEDISDFLVETNIQSIANTSKALMLIDTPGVNNSNDVSHYKITKEFIDQMDMGAIIYLLNATQLATNDDAGLLDVVFKHIKKTKGRVNILFVINKIDSLDTEKENIMDIVRETKKYIESHGFKNPVIYPISALAAKALRMILYHKEMTRRERRQIEDIYNTYCSKDNNMMDYAIIDEISDETYEIGDNIVSAQAIRKAIDNTGITFIEKKIESLMRSVEKHYSPEVFIKSELSDNIKTQYRKQLENLSEISVAYNWEVINDLKNKIQNNENLFARNMNLPDKKEIKLTINLANVIMDVIPYVQDLISNFEETKKYFDEIFIEYRFVSLKHLKGQYLFPEINVKSHISMIDLFLMSKDGINWYQASFSAISKEIENGNEIYIYNEYVTFLYKISKENKDESIALLDAKIPISYIKIAGLDIENASIDDISKFLYTYDKYIENEKRSIDETQNQLRRTYKGVVFKTEEEKERIIKLDNEINKYLENIEKFDYEEIYLKKNEISKLPEGIFEPYMSKLVIELDIKEREEKNKYISKISFSELNQIDILEKEIEKHNYSESTKMELINCCKKRKYVCKRQNLECMIANMKTFSRSELENLMGYIKQTNYDNSLVEEYLNKVQNQIDILENRELTELCAYLEQKDIYQLEELLQTIKNKKIQDKFSEPYVKRINSQIELRHIKNMEQYCSQVTTANRDSLKKIKHNITIENCSPQLKDKYYKIISERYDVLDYQELCALTEELEIKSLSELEKLYNDFKQGNYNGKYINKFLLKVRIALEKAQINNINNMIANLSNMNKKEVICLKEKIKNLSYEDRIIYIANKKIEERIYILDVIELININNDFDKLTLDEIRNLRRDIVQRDITERSKNIYLEKLSLRERIIGLSNVSRNAAYAQEKKKKMLLENLGIEIALFSDTYNVYLEDYFKNIKERDYENIPILFLPEISMFALSKEAIYYRYNSEYVKVKLSEIRNFSVTKKLFMDSLEIIFTNGNSVILSGIISRKYSNKLVEFLTNIIMNINNGEILSNYGLYTESVLPLKIQDLQEKYVPSELSFDYICNELLYEKIKKNYISSILSPIKYQGVSNWELYKTKVITGFDLSPETKILLCYDRTLLNSAKDGIVFCDDFITFKDGNKNLYKVFYKDIYNMEQTKSNEIRIITVDNIVYITEFTLQSEEMTRNIICIFSDFIRAVQLIN